MLKCGLYLHVTQCASAGLYPEKQLIFAQNKLHFKGPTCRGTLYAIVCIFPIFVDGTSCANECQRNRRERLVTFRNPKEWNEHLPNFFHLTSPRSRGRRIIFFHRRSRYVTRCKIHTSYTHCTARKYLLVITSLKAATKLRGAGGRVGDCLCAHLPYGGGHNRLTNTRFTTPISQIWKSVVRCYSPCATP